MRLDHLLLGSKNCSEEAIEEIAEEDEEVSKSKRKEVLRLISFLFVFNKRVLSLAGREGEGGIIFRGEGAKAKSNREEESA